MVSAPPSPPPSDVDDVALMREAARGELTAISAIYDRFAGLLMTMAEKILTDRAMAEDLVHDVFLEVWRHAASYDPTRGSVRAWLLVRLRSRALDRLRSAKTRREVATDDGEPGHAPAEEREDPVLEPDRKAVRRALAELPVEQREVIELAYFHGLSSSEIAARMGSPLGTVKSRTAAGLAKLRSVMQIDAATDGRAGSRGEVSR
ncbi:MAG: sigma-70 family RNA polymerase sigma factor [Nannocystaceae bacterium]